MRTIRVSRNILRVEPKLDEEPFVVDAVSIKKYGIIAIRSIIFNQSFTNLIFSSHDKNRNKSSAANRVFHVIPSDFFFKHVKV